MSIKIGHASGDENRRAYGGKAGDQTGTEVCIRTWYSSPWNVVLRPKDPAKAEKMARACEAACANDNIGYDQYQRNTLNSEADDVGYDLSKIREACETDCSALMAVCAQAAGIDVPYISGNAPYTGIQKNQFLKTGEFEALTDSKYLTSDVYLKRGDILLRESGHTAIALENGSKAGGSDASNVSAPSTPAASSTVKLDVAHKYSRDFGNGGKGKVYTVTASALNMRSGAGTTKKIIKVLPKGTKVTCYGYYNVSNTTPWLLVVTPDGTKGYCSKNYLH